MNVYRLHIRPQGGLANPEVSFAYCLQAQVLGVGWQTYSDKPISSWADYETEASRHHPDLSRVRYLKDRVKPDDLLWTRCPAGNYHLARVASEWEYLTSQQAQDADIVNVVRCQILKVPAVDDVPGKIVACFRAARTIQAIADETSRHYSQFLWNKLSGTSTYSLPAHAPRSLFSMLGAEATEDVLFLYLQTQGWLVVPNSRKADTMSYEFYLIHRQTRQRAIIQIKTGNTGLCTSDWKNRAEHVFLFQSNGLYSGEPQLGVECLSPEAVEVFMWANRDLFPANILFWLDYAAPNRALEPKAAEISPA
jgi:hypothetical protein